MRYKVRIKLTDFINKTGEQTVVDELVRLAEESRRGIFLDLWYREGEVTPEQVKEFVSRHEDALETVGTRIHVGDSEHWTQKSWFNIRTPDEKNATEYRHEYIYALGKLDDLLTGIALFRKMVLTTLGVRQEMNQVPSTSITASSRAVEQQRKGYRVVIRRVNGDIQK